ncbi:MAG: helix-turn-helix transcriptional regulator [Janthinobacterium lividum]
MGLPRLEIQPRLLTRQQAAAYCGVSVPTFNAHCPVVPLAMGPGKRLERFDVRALDEWISGKPANEPHPAHSWLDQL